MTDSDSLNYIPNWGTLIVVEIAALIGFMVFEIILLRAFYRKQREFPKLYVSYLVASSIFWIVDWFVGSKVLDEPGTPGVISQQVIFCAVWIPYMLTSRRVKNTFVRTDKNESVNGAHSGETG